MASSENVDVQNLHVATVLPAGGTGERAGLAIPKQFTRVLGRPLISYTIDAFDRVPWISDIVVPVADISRPNMEALVAESDWRCVRCTTGGTTRHRSIASGVIALSKGSKHPDVVIIHDAVRPLVDGSTLGEVVAAAHKYGAAGVVRPLVSTVVRPDKEMFLDSTLTRQHFRASEMPQAFRFSVLHQAYQMCSEEELDHGTECLELARKYGQAKVQLLEGPDNLWKVTYKKDLYAFKGILKEDKAVVLISNEEDCLSVSSTLKELKVKVHQCSRIESLQKETLTYCTTVIQHYRISPTASNHINGPQEHIKSFCSILKQKLEGRRVGVVILLECEDKGEILTQLETDVRACLKAQKCAQFTINCLLSQTDCQEEQASLLSVLIDNAGGPLDGQLLVA